MADRTARQPEVLLARAEHSPDAIAYEFVDDMGTVSALTYGQLAGRASALAAELAGPGRGPALVLYPAGLEYVVALYGAFLAGLPVVPAYPVDALGPDRERLADIAADSQVSVVLAPGGAQVPEGTSAALRAVPGADADTAGWYTPVRQELAVIQYTSGSTGRPRGVRVRHDSVAANTAAITESFGLHRGSRAMSWLPPFHDMGLVGGIFTPMAVGIPVRLMSPLDFLQAPLSWLRQIAESGATVSGGPNFAYDLCLRRARRIEDFSELDLSGWQVAFNGAETVRERTLAAFAERFASAGFSPGAFLPCYGLAEATLIVTAGRWKEAAPQPDGRVACGAPVTGQHLVLVDPDRERPVGDEQEGEVWINGPHITDGYWSGEDEGLFGELDGQQFLRTGDLGLLRDGQLVITGRRKDVIVHHGVNHHAVDIEDAALAALGPRAGVAAAFQTEDAERSAAVIVVEVRGGAAAVDAALVRTAVLDRNGLLLDEVLLVPPRTIPRTSSGKVRRADCRMTYRGGGYPEAVRLPAAEASDRKREQQTAKQLTELVCGVAAEVCELPRCGPADDLAALGIDSLRAADTVAVLQDALGERVPLALVLAERTPRRVADALVSHWAAEDALSRVSRRIDRLTADVAEAETA